LVCLVLAALLAAQLVRVALRAAPLRNVQIPALPTLSSDTNAPAAPSAKVLSSKTNVVTADVSGGTNPGAAKKPAKGQGTNSVAPVAETNGVRSALGLTNVAAANVATNPPVNASLSETNAAPAKMLAGTNGLTASLSSTNSLSKSSNAPSPKAMAPAAAATSMPPARGGSGGGKTDLAPETKARVDRIYESELFGQVMRPQPPALMGIAGDAAFLRSPSGQTGLVKEGDSLGELKLVRIGINRVLVESEGKKSELMIFNGYGGESLMEKETAK
jgi:hypothetical protein